MTTGEDRPAQKQGGEPSGSIKTEGASEAKSAPFKIKRWHIVIAVIVFLSVLGNLVGGPTITMEGDTAKVEVMLSSWNSLGYAADRVSEAVYEAAAKHPKATKIVVLLRMSSSGLKDQYGYSISGPLEMGQITIQNPEDARKHRDKNVYSMRNEALYKIQIKRMNHAYLLDD